MTEERPTSAGDPASRFSDAKDEDWQVLFGKLAGGDAGTLGFLYDLAAPRIFGLALWRTGSHDDACDVVQEVFVRVAEQRERLRRVRDPRSWILAVAHRAAVDVVRRRNRRRTEAIEERAPFLEAEGTDADRALDAQRANGLLARLPSAQREAIYLHNHAGCTFATIGNIVGCPTFTAASRYRLGIAKLQKMMKTEGER